MILLQVDLSDMGVRYGIIYGDPPWPQKKGKIRNVRMNQGRSLDYDTMSLSDIELLLEKAFLLSDIKCNIFIWTIDKFLLNTESMMKRMGYELHARIIWDKGNGIAPAFTVRFSHEYLLWFYQKGHILMPCKEVRGVFRDVLYENSTVHSKKPESAYQMLETMFPDAAELELFARNERDGWDCFGDQVDYFDS